jgi:two-component system, sensor histidine kinase and response regulator
MKNARVLIVDDDPGALQALSETLELRMRGLGVETVDCALAALERLSACEFDAVVADIKMPGMDGLEMLGRIRELRPEIPTLLITGHGEHELAVQALRGGAHDYITKPIDREYFVRSLQHAIERHRLSRNVARQRRSLENERKKLESWLEDRTLEFRELYEREALTRAELEKTTAELHAARDRRDELISMIAHDLGSPLTTLRGYAELLARPNASPAVRDRAKRVILSETDRMARLVQDLMSDPDTATTRFSIRIRDCDLVELAREQTEVAKTRSPRHLVALESPEHLLVRCDPQRVAQVFVNLLNNALAYAPDGQILVRLWPQGNDVHVSVRDHGPGIPSAALQTIFEPHVRLQPSGKGQRASGVGLGLSIARDIVEAHRGQIWAENNPDRGATFTVVLPACVERVAA